ncbi:MAG: heme exporter protein CcmD [Betaproteobacteria bacterium RIFCSPLOWO2_02_FULL_63_19]|nr:MAG: heme exporter protein CcmD [Betaproteobacteria bacterium RIFCSPLOWO2_02_FULL_63_19]
MIWNTYWSSIDAFFAMGGYGLYVWGSYAVTAAGLTIEIALLAARRRRTLRMLAQLHGQDHR